LCYRYLRELSVVIIVRNRTISGRLSHFFGQLLLFRENNATL